MEYRKNYSENVDTLSTSIGDFFIVDASDEDNEKPQHKLSFAARVLNQSYQNRDYQDPQLHQAHIAGEIVNSLDVDDLYDTLDLHSLKLGGYIFETVIVSTTNLSLSSFTVPGLTLNDIIANIKKHHNKNMIFIFKTNEDKIDSAHQKILWKAATHPINTKTIIYNIVKDYEQKDKLLIIVYAEF